MTDLLDAIIAAPDQDAAEALVCEQAPEEERNALLWAVSRLFSKRCAKEPYRYGYYGHVEDWT